MVYFAPDTGGSSGGGVFAGISQTLSQLSGGLNAQNQAEQAQAQPDGLTDKEEGLAEALKNLDAHTQALYRELTEGNENLRRLQEETQDLLSKTVGETVGGSDKENGEASIEKTMRSVMGDEGSGGRAKDNPKPSDLLNLKAEYALGPLLLYYKLDAIHKSITSPEGKKKDGDGGGLKNLFGNLLKGAGSLMALAAALIIFAGAAVVFSVVDWGKALAGLALFAGFVVGAVAIASIMKANDKAIKDFAVGALALSAGFFVFSLTFLIIDQIKGDWGRYLTILGIFAIFIAGAVIVSNLVGKNIMNFVQFAVGSTILALSFIVFAVALKVIDYIGSMLTPTTFLIFGAILLTLVAVAAISYAMAPLMPAFILFGVGSILFSISLMVFAKALEIVNKIKQEDLVKGIAIIAQIQALFLVVGAIGTLGLIALPGLVGFAAMSILLTAGLLAFWGASAILAQIDFVKTLVQFVAFAAVLLVMNTTFILLSAVSLLGMVAIVPFTAFSALFLVSMLAFWGAIAVLNQISFESIIGGIGKVGLMVGLVAASGVLGLAALPAIPLAVPLGIWALTVLGIIERMISVIEKLDKLNINREQLGQKIGSLDFLIHGISDNIHIGLGEIGSMTMFSLATVPMLLAFDNMVRLLENMQKITDAGVSESSLATPLGAIKLMVETVGKLADSFAGPVLEKLVLFNQTLLLLSNSVKAIAETIVILGTFNESMVAQGTSKIKLIMEGLFNTDEDDGKHWSFTALFNRIGKVSKNAKDAAEVIEPMAKGISAIADTIVKLNGIENVAGNVQKMNDIGSLFVSVESSIKIISNINVDAVRKANDVVQGLNTVAPGLAQFQKAVNDIGDMWKVRQLFTIIPDNWDSWGYVGKMGDLSKGLKIMSESFATFQTTHITDFSNALQRLATTTNIGNAIDPLITLIDRKESLKDVAAAMERMAIANKQMSVNRTLFTSIDNMGTAPMAPVKKVNSSRAPVGGNGDAMSGIMEILMTWNERGVPMRTNPQFTSSVADNSASKLAAQKDAGPFSWLQNLLPGGQPQASSSGSALPKFPF